ncbi:MAG: acyltransferase [Ruminococcus sp.]|uniref:acyltransferase n=1 Tax=Ruminococcus sp. TaxID=41978 RepID=UPI00287380BA|nr:acyltransferase [Ruminococcus sp.]MBQ3285214.1 acyltransferase [Ruminococcus sp.]
MSFISRVFHKKTAEEQHKELLYSKGLITGNNFNCYSWLGIDPSMPWLITIGDDVTISFDVHIITHDASTNKAGLGTKIGQVKIGNNCFIGAGSIILCGVTIGDSVVVGAGSVVTHDIPSNTVAGGNPAKMITSFEKWKEKNTCQRETQHFFDELPWQEWLNADVEHRKKMVEILEKTGGYGYF